MLPPDASEHDRLRRRSWSSYWAGGALTSLPEDFPANYDGEIRAFWRQRCDALDDGAAVLDVCTGNGAVALLIAEAASDREIHARITAVDLADIRPELIRQRFPAVARHVDAIRFVGGRSFEELDLADASQDLIVSQYGIEYCEPEAAAAQCARLLRPGAELAVVTHAPDSDMRETMQTELEQFERLDALGLNDAVERWRAGTASTERLRESLGAIGRSLRAERALPESGLFRYALGLCEQAARCTAAQLDDQKAALLAGADQLRDGRSRMEQMLEVNERLVDADRWAGVFEDAGLRKIGAGRLRYRERHEVGHWWRFERSAD